MQQERVRAERKRDVQTAFVEVNILLIVQYPYYQKMCTGKGSIMMTKHGLY